MAEALMEHVVLRTCVTDGYQCKDMSGETKLNYFTAVGSFYIPRSYRHGH